MAASRRVARSDPALKWALLTLFMSAALLVTAVRAYAAEEKCSDFTTDNRPCTAMEEYGYCLHNAMESYDDCVGDVSGLLQRMWRETWCGVAFDVDFIACTIALPFDGVKKVFN